MYFGLQGRATDKCSFLQLQGCTILFLTLLFDGVAGQTTSVQTYPVNWADVPTTPPTSTNLTTNCNCALQTIGCSFGCCCDPQCPSTVNSLFESVDQCLPSGLPQQTLKWCVPNGIVFKVNLPTTGDFYVRPVVQADDTRFFSQLLCITSDRNPDVGDTYPDPPPGAVGDNAKLAQCPVPVQQPAAPVVYQFQSYVYVHLGSPSAQKQPLTVPYPAFSGECNDQYVVGYMMPTPTGNKNYYVGCQRNLKALNLSTACSGAGLLTPDYYSTMYFQTGQSATSVEPFTLVQMQFEDPSTGVLTTVTNAVSSYNATTGKCRNVVRYLNITLFYSYSAPSGTIDKVEVTFVLTDVLSSSTPMPQSVRVSWLSTSSATDVEFVNSGNPGYLTNFPLLAGTLVTNSDGRQAISRLVTGMPVPAPGPNGACNATSQTTTRYGANLTSSCSVPLTAAQLKDFCITGADHPEKYVALAMSTLLNSVVNNQLYFGEWGNSAFSDINTWIQVQVSGFPFNQSRLSYTELDKACSGVVLGYDLQIVTGVAFASNNLQQKVLYANLCFRTGVWDFPNWLPETTPVDFYLNFTVSYIRLPQQAVMVKRPAPPLVVPLPADIFYPFVITDSAAAGNRVGVWFAVLVAALALVALPHVH